MPPCGTRKNSRVPLACFSFFHFCASAQGDSVLHMSIWLFHGNTTFTARWDGCRRTTYGTRKNSRVPLVCFSFLHFCASANGDSVLRNRYSFSFTMVFQRHPVRWNGCRRAPCGTRKNSRVPLACFSFLHFCASANGEKKNNPSSRGCFCSLVPVVGLEPTRILLHRILSPARLPVSPHRHHTGARDNIAQFSGFIKCF